MVVDCFILGSVSRYIPRGKDTWNQHMELSHSISVTKIYNIGGNLNLVIDPNLRKAGHVEIVWAPIFLFNVGQVFVEVCVFEAAVSVGSEDEVVPLHQVVQLIRDTLQYLGYRLRWSASPPVSRWLMNSLYITGVRPAW